MAEFGKLNFAVAFAPQTAFPLDARYYFDSLEAAKAAALSAVEVGSDTGTYFYGENVVVVTSTSATLYLIQPNNTLKEVGAVPVGDGKSIEVVDGKIVIKGFGAAKAGQQLRIGTNGNVEWFTPDTTTVDGLSATVAGHTTDIANLNNNKADKATTLAGYGITDAYTKEETESKIAAAGHATFKKVDAIPDVATAESNVLYLVMNTETGYYDIYAKIDNAVVRLDDVSVNLDAYSTTEQMNAAIANAVKNKVDKVEGSRLINADEINKLATVLEGAEPNVVKSVDAGNFVVDETGKLTLTAVTEAQVTGLTEALSKKATAEGLTAVAGRVTTVENELTTAKATIETQGTAITGLQATVGTLGTDVETAKTDISGLKSKVEANEAAITALQGVTSTLDTTYLKVERYTTEVGAFSGLVHHANDNSTIIDEINDLNTRLTWTELSE